MGMASKRACRYLYVPGSHATHALVASSAEVPGAQLEQAALPGMGCTLPAAHTEHAVAPADSAKVPGSQSTHGLAASSAAVPGEQVVQASLPGMGCTVPGPHAEHAVAPADSTANPGAHN